MQNPKFYSSTDPGKNNSALKLTEWQRKVTAINRSIGCILCDPSKSQRLEGPEESKDNQGMDGCNKCWTQQANRKIIKGTFRRTALNLKSPPVTFGLHFLLFFDLSVAIKLCKWISFVCKRDIPKRNRGRSWSWRNKNLFNFVFLHSTSYATTIIYLSFKESFNYLKWNLLIWWTTSNWDSFHTFYLWKCKGGNLTEEPTNIMHSIESVGTLLFLNMTINIHVSD